jgi:ATP-dependent DNA helicase 2 subunit 2
MFLGEVRYMWPDVTSLKAQIQWSALVSALMTTEFVAIARWVMRANAPPDVGVCIPQQEFPGDGKKLDLMYWVKLPFADDDHKFFFPSLTNLKSVEGNEIAEHPFLPTDEQCALMDELVAGMDLDTVGRPPKEERKNDDDDEDEEEEGDEDEDMEDDLAGRWFDPARCYNPVIHRLKEAIFHASVTEDTVANPLPPPHPDLVKYFNTPEEISLKVEKVSERLKDALEIRKVPPRQRKRVAQEGLADDEGL